MKKYIRNVSYIKTGDIENKISEQSLNNRTVRNEGILRVWPELVRFLVVGILRGGSEKGSTRKHTGKRVTRWTFLFWRNFKVLRCFAKRIFLGEFKLALFGGFGGGST
jgi:hypothetical protein